MFKLWRRNKDKGGVKAKKPRKIALFTCAAALLASVTGASLMLGLNSHNGGNLGGDSFINTGIHGNTISATSAPSSGLDTNYSHEFHLKGTSAQMAATWNEAIAASSTTANVLVVLDNEDGWEGVTGSAGFGSGDGFDGGSLLVPSGKKITLDLNGKTINRKANGDATTNYANVISCKGTLTLLDGVGTGKITGGHVVGQGGGIKVTGTLKMYGGDITGNAAGYTGKEGADGTGGGVYVASGATFEMYGGSITDNNGDPSEKDLGGGGVFVHDGTFTMNGGVISGNYAGWGGGVEIYQDGLFTMNGGTNTDNTGSIRVGGG